MKYPKNFLTVPVVAFACAICALPVWAFEIHFLRHGETVWNRSKVLQGSMVHLDLSSRGVRMAEATAKGMAAAGVRYDRIYASNLRRAAHTAEIIADAQGLVPKLDGRIREMGLGRYEGVRYGKGDYPDENLRNFFEGTGPYVPAGDGAESFDDVAARLRDFMEKELLPLEGKVDKVLCVAHSFVLKTLVRELAGDGASAEAKKPIQRNCCIHVVDCSNGKFTLKETGRIFYDAAEFEELPEPTMVAHRGAGDINGRKPESSKAAYSNAVATACDVVKLDLQETRDKVIVMHHDPTLKRMMDWDVKISDLDYAEIFEKGRYFGPGRRLDRGTERIVRLDEALAITRTIPQFWVDFKYFTPDFADRVFKTFADAGIDFSRIIVATFNTAALEYVQGKYPNVRRVSHINWTFRPEMKSFTGSMRTGYMATRERVLQCILDRCRRLGLYGVNMPYSKTVREDVEFLHANGIKWVSLYFVQDLESACRVRPWKANAFVTDHVSEVRKAYAPGDAGKEPVAARGTDEIWWPADAGFVKPVNGVGQPPMQGLPRKAKMIHYLKEAGIPYSRLHDVGGPYGRMTYVDVPNIFRNFDADENDPANYDFAFTDRLMDALAENGVEPFYRLGVTIENFPEVKRYRLDPPKDYAKWARIAEHVIRHYTEGWAGGRKMKVTYWEIWNEPENYADPDENCMWRGDWKSFMDFYGVVAPYLKKKFPHLKIGGYASCGFYAAVGANAVTAANSSTRTGHFVKCAHDFLARARDERWPLDFFSFHSYSKPDAALRQVAYARKMLDSYGFTKTEMSFNEWLPAPSFESKGTARQASMIAAELVGLQNSPCDTAMIYDARCGTGNYSPLFNPMTEKPHKAYYAFVAFNELRKLGMAVVAPPVERTGLYVAAAKDAAGENGAVMVANCGDASVPLGIDFGGKVVSCRITDGSRTHAPAELPKAMPAHSFIIVRTEIEKKGS